MEALPNWMVWIGVLALCALVTGGLLALLAGGAPPENRPAPPERMADREAARVATLSKIAARHRGSV
jgi:hypothetical protein